MNKPQATSSHHQWGDELAHNASKGIVEHSSKRDTGITALLGRGIDTGVGDHACQKQHVTTMAADFEDAALKVHLKTTD